MTNFYNKYIRTISFKEDVDSNMFLSLKVQNFKTALIVPHMAQKNAPDALSVSGALHLLAVFDFQRVVEFKMLQKPFFFSTCEHIKLLQY